MPLLPQKPTFHVNCESKVVLKHYRVLAGKTFKEGELGGRGAGEPHFRSSTFFVGGAGGALYVVKLFC